MPRRRSLFWSEEELARFRAMYPETSNVEIAAVLQRSAMAVKQKARILGLRKSGDYFARIQREKSERSRLTFSVRRETETPSGFHLFELCGTPRYGPTGTPAERAGRIERLAVEGQRLARTEAAGVHAPHGPKAWRPDRSSQSWNSGKYR